jgi:signal transduction histidine kinase
MELIELFAEEAVEAFTSNEASVELVLARERRRIAREMHDDVKTNVRTIVMDAQRALRFLTSNPAELEHEIEDIVQIGWSTIRAIDTILENLSAQDTHQQQLDVEIDEELSTMPGRGGDKLRTNLQSDLPMVDFAVAQAVRRILREAVINAFTHSEAEEIEVTTRLEEDVFVLQVRDNGRGFDYHPDLTGTHQGLIIMHERIDEIQEASLTVQSVPGEGTTITARIPCRRPDAEELSQ